MSRLWRIIIGYSLFGYGYVVAATFIVAMAENLQTSGWDARTAWMVVGASTVPSVYLWQWFAMQQGLMRALFCSYLVLTAGAFIAGWADGFTWLIFSCILLGGTFGGVTALGLSAARAIAPQRVAYAVSTMTIGFSIGQLLGPAVSGRLADAAGGFFWPSVVAALLLLIAALLVPLAHDRLFRGEP